MTHPDQVMTSTDSAAVAVHMLTSLSTSVGEVKLAMSKISEEQTAQRDMLTRFDERQIIWATKQEVSEGLAHLRELIAPIAAQTSSAHMRLDGFDIDLTGVKNDFDAHDLGISRRLDAQREADKAQMERFSGEIIALRLSWARAGGLAAAGGLFGSTGTAVVLKLAGVV